jgi:hypothetical protein
MMSAVQYKRCSAPRGRSLAIVTLSTLFSLPGIAAVDVEPSFGLTRESLDLPAEKIAAYEYELRAGSELVIGVRLEHWRRDPLRIWLVDARNYEKLLTGRAFDYFDSATGMIRREAQITFDVTDTGRYYVVLDNLQSTATRRMEVYAFVRTQMPGPADERTQSFYEAHYDALSDLIDMEGISVQVRRCGEANAYTIGSRVVICRELDNLLAATEMAGVRLFVLLHEIAHALIANWGYRSIVRDQIMVDRLAATLFTMLDEDDAAEKAARWFLRRASDRNDPMLDELFALSKSRARRIAASLREEGELNRFWTRRIVVPRIRTAALENLARAAHLDETSRRRLALELSER